MYARAATHVERVLFARDLVVRSRSRDLKVNPPSPDCSAFRARDPEGKLARVSLNLVREPRRRSRRSLKRTTSKEKEWMYICTYPTHSCRRLPGSSVDYILPRSSGFLHSTCQSSTRITRQIRRGEPRMNRIEAWNRRIRGRGAASTSDNKLDTKLDNAFGMRHSFGACLR